jgi:DNA-binding CsgD family transcriptional regulator
MKVSVIISQGAGHLPPAENMLMTLFDLTAAEARVMALAGAGRSPGEISRELSVSDNTVKTHLSRIYDKSGANRLAEIVVLVGALAMP